MTCITGGASINRHIQRRFKPIATVVVCIWLAGCSGLSPIFEADPVPQPDASSAAPADSPPTPVEPPRERSRVAILLSDDIASYSAIAKQITQRISEHDYITLNLDGAAAANAPVMNEINKFDPDKIAAIGLLAARVGRNFSSRPMVFCQVFNYTDHELVSPSSKGVKFLPPFSLQLEVWKVINPDLKRVGFITGPNQQELVAEIKQAAEHHQVQVLTRTAASDKEALYAFKRLTPQIQGFWLLPDNRVLSPRVLREMVSYGRKHGIQTVVFSPQLLGLGADISIASRDVDVADAVLRALGDTVDKDAVADATMLPLTTLHLEVRPEITDGLDTESAEKLAQYLEPNRSSAP